MDITSYLPPACTYAAESLINSWTFHSESVLILWINRLIRHYLARNIVSLVTIDQGHLNKQSEKTVANDCHPNFSNTLGKRI